MVVGQRISEQKTASTFASKQTKKSWEKCVYSINYLSELNYYYLATPHALESNGKRYSMTLEYIKALWGSSFSAHLTDSSVNFTQIRHLTSIQMHSSKILEVLMASWFRFSIAGSGTLFLYISESYFCIKGRVDDFLFPSPFASASQQTCSFPPFFPISFLLKENSA